MRVQKNPLENGPLPMMLDSIAAQKDLILGKARWREDALTTKLKTHTIDTCEGFDTGLWETGVQPKNGKWIIVEQYKNEAEARNGHVKWVNKLKANSKTNLTDVFLADFQDDA